jgi:hypothetical protein
VTAVSGGESAGRKIQRNATQLCIGRGENSMPKIKQECEDCKGTGLYSGFAEREGEAVICCSCSGKGWYFYSFKEFTKRKRKNGIKIIRESGGRFLATGVGGTGPTMTYAEFRKNVPET